MEIITVFLIFMALSLLWLHLLKMTLVHLALNLFVYGQTWFEFIMLFLTIGVIFNIIWFKMYKKDKFLSL